MLGIREKFARSLLGILSVASIMFVWCALISVEVGKGIYIRSDPDRLHGGRNMKDLQPNWGNSLVFHEVTTIVGSFVLPVAFIMVAQHLYEVFSLTEPTLKIIICVHSLIWMILLMASSARFIEQIVPDPEYQYRILHNTSVFINESSHDTSNTKQWIAFVASIVFGVFCSISLGAVAVLCILDFTHIIAINRMLDQ